MADFFFHLRLRCVKAPLNQLHWNGFLRWCSSILVSSCRARMYMCKYETSGWELSLSAAETDLFFDVVRQFQFAWYLVQKDLLVFASERYNLY